MIQIGNHTPGPWKARDYQNANGDTWIDCNAFANKGQGRCLGGTLATVHHTGTGEGTMEANANLIAASPEMLEALIALRTVFDFTKPVADGAVLSFEKTYGVNTAFRKAAAAIAKALGQTA